VNGEAELLWTRCGSEAYAAPELVTGGGGGSGGGGGESDRGGVYDARKTDAWACGVVLYALVARHLPFGEGVEIQPIGDSQIGEEQSAGRGSLAERRHWLMRIARGEYEWPGECAEESQSDVEVEKEKEKDELVGSGLIHSQEARRIVGRLLIRDPRKRARIGDLWDDSWMALSSGGDEVWRKEREQKEPYDLCPFSMIMRKTSMEGSLLDYGLGHENGHEAESCPGVHSRTVLDHAEVGVDSLRDLDDGEEEEEEDGCLFDHEGIDSITRQEVV
jgi:protein-serine/threonine kinase